MHKKLLLTMLLVCAGAANLLAQSVETVTTGLFEPYDVAVDPSNNAYYFTDSANNRVIRYHPEDDPKETIMGVVVDNPQGIAFTSKRGGAAGALVIADSNNHRVRIVPLNGGAIVDIGGPDAGNSDAPAKFRFPYGVDVDADGNIYVADTQNGSIRKIALDNSVSTIATGFNRPNAVHLGNNQIFVADTGNGDVVTLTTGGARVGAPIKGFTAPRGLLWLGGQTGLLVSDASEHAIWSTGLGRVFAGSNSGDSGNVNGTFPASRFSGPTGLALDNNGHILVADLFNSSLRTIKRSLVTAPLLSFSAGSYSNAITIAITNKITTANSAFHFTNDETDPSVQSALMVDKKLSLDGAPGGQAIIKIRGFSPDFASSIILSNNYNFFVDAPAFNIAGGNFTTNVDLKISTKTDGAVLKFINPVTGLTNLWPGSTNYGTSGPLVIWGEKNGYVISAVVSNNFQFTVTNPGLTPVAGTYNNAITVAVTNSTPETTFRFKLDGNTPSDSSDIATNGFYTLARNALETNSLFTVRGFKTGYTNSASTQVSYSFKVAPLSISVPGGEFLNHTNVLITTATEGAEIRYSLDSATPTNTTGIIWINTFENGKPFGTSGKLVARAFREGFLPSDPITNTFKFTVTAVTAVPNGGTFTNDLRISFTNSTAGTVFHYTKNGTLPTIASDSTTTNFVLNGNFASTNKSEVIVFGIKDGYAGTTEWKGEYSFRVADPTITVPDATNGVYINSLVIKPASGTTNAAIGYHLNNGNPTNILPLGGSLTIDTTNAVKLIATRENYISSAIITVSYPVQVDKPVLSPTNGFFPSGGVVTVSVIRPGAKLFYTTDGTDPTTNSFPVPANREIKVNSLVFPIADLRTLKVRAFADNVIPSEVASGDVLNENTIGIPGDLVGDVGAEMVIPVVLNLKKDQIVRSFQFNVQFAAANHPAGALHNAGEITPLSVISDDLVAKADGSLNSGPSTNWSSQFFISGPGGIITNALSIYTKGTNSNFAVKDYGLVALVKVNLPTSAVVGDKFTIQVTNPSATEDAFQKDVPLTSMPARTITVQKLEYLIGDSSPSGWYNAGDFGNGILDNSDVNNALYASFGIRRPYLFSDLFNAMDVFPDPSPEFPEGGDGDIRLLDYQRVLDLSLRRMDANYKRSRTAAGRRIATAFELGGEPLTPGETLSSAPSGNVWVREASLAVTGSSRVEPGQTAEAPVWIQVARGKSVSGLMFRAQVVSINGAPAVTEGVSFSHSVDVSVPQIIPMDAKNEVAALWDIGSINPALTGRKLLGTVKFKVPASARLGHAYRIQFAVVDGAPDNRTQYNLESFPAWVWIKSDAPADLPAISDEWKIRFFGSINGPLADALADADNDGVPNWREFLAGTNPTDIRSRLNLARPELRQIAGRLGVALRFLSATGKTYIIESTTDIASGQWTIVAEGVVGDGSLKEFIDTADPTAGKFYRIRLQ